MSEIDANIIVEGQKAVATIPQDGEIIEDGGEIDATCIVEDSNGKRHKAVKIVNIDDEPSDKSEIDAQVSNNNNELIMVTEEQDGEIIPENNSEIDFHCLVQKDDGKQLSIKTVELDGEIIKTGGAIDATCLVQGSDGKRYKAVKVFNLGGTSDWKNKPADWSDIRKDCPANSIALYAGVKSDYSQYDNLGFTATCTGGYNVFIDGVQYGSTYASGATCTITWSTSGITTGDDITTPSAMKAHKIWIQPATEGNNITRFQFKRVSGSVQEEQGCLWCHFNLNTSINLQRFSAEQNTVWQKLCEAITAKNNTIKFLQYGTGWLLRGMPNIKYIPVLDCNNTDAYFNYMASNLTNLTSITVKNANVVSADDAFSESISIENIKFVNVDTSSCSSLPEMFRNNRSLRQLPDLNLSSATVAFSFLTNATALENTILDVSFATGLQKISCYGTSTYFMTGFKGLRVSNQAPFSGTAPQINVSYTGMDRQALVTLFNDLPTVSDGQIINVTGCTGANNLTADDKTIATAKGWTITL